MKHFSRNFIVAAVASADQMCEAKMDQESAESDKVVDSSPPPSAKTRPLTPQSQDDMSSDDLISVGGSPSPSLTSPDIISRNMMEDSEDEYFRPLKKLRMLQVVTVKSRIAIAPSLKISIFLFSTLPSYLVMLSIVFYDVVGAIIAIACCLKRKKCQAGTTC